MTNDNNGGNNGNGRTWLYPAYMNLKAKMEEMERAKTRAEDDKMKQEQAVEMGRSVAMAVQQGIAKALGLQAEKDTGKSTDNKTFTGEVMDAISREQAKLVATPTGERTTRATMQQSTRS